MFEEKVSLEQATKEVEGWLDFKKVSEKKRDTYKDAIQNLIEGIQYGLVIVEDDFKIKQVLKFPLMDASGATFLSELVFVPRITSVGLKKYAGSIIPNNGNSKLLATAAALCDKGVSHLEKLDTEDLNTVQSVAIFFI